MNNDQLFDQCVWEIEDFLYRMIKRKINALISVRISHCSQTKLSTQPPDDLELKIRNMTAEAHKPTRK